jgi:hypothetical protein
MANTFNNLVEDVRSLSLSEKIEIKNIIQKSIIQERRNKIKSHYKTAEKELENNKLDFSSDMNTLKKMMQS